MLRARCGAQLSSMRYARVSPAMQLAVHFSQQRIRALHASATVAQSKKDPYSVLGLSKGADKDEVKKAYYKLVKK
jgi:preprotein translocase subunit Sec63